ncbi:MAG: DEAD/DEAH box helicase, partial [Silvibacterium sp.]
MNQFSDFQISANLKKQLATANFITPTPVQSGAIPPGLEGRDVLATAQTGTGKTLSFLIPLIERMPQGKGCSALILLPTRELAMQVEQVYRKLTGNYNSVALVVGGMAEGPQLQTIRRGARVIVATPGRLEDYLQRKLVNLSGVKMLVLDEVDRMLDMGFKPAIKRIASALPADRQTMCYSATLSPQIKEVVRDDLKNPARIEIGSVLKPCENVELQTFEVATEKKHELLEHLLDQSKGRFLVFVRTKHGADRVARRLARSGHTATQIHGDRSQSQRNAALKSFSQGHHRVLVATDVAARGIDVVDVAHVVNYDMPREAEDFVHRIG